MNNEIELLFKNFIVDGKKIPVEFANYEGSSEEYVVYFSNGEHGSSYSDDKLDTTTVEYDFNIYSKSNFLNILNELKKILYKNGWNFIEDSEDIYESDTHFFHKVTTWNKERDEIIWQELD